MNPPVRCFNNRGSRTCGSCPPGYQGNGESCTYQGPCQAVPNGGCHPMAFCVSSGAAGMVQCICRPGFTGNYFL